MLFVLLRGEHAYEFVPTVEAPRASYSQECQEGGAFWLGEDREKLFTLRSSEIQQAKNAKLDQ